jgi:predicted aspartyl protease
MTTPATTKATTGRWLLVFVTLGLSFLVSSTKAADDRLWLHATINGTPARLCFDTGFESVALTSDAAKRFGLKATNAPLHEGAASGKIML